MQLTEKDEQRFWNKVALPNEQGCMEWMAALNGSGYGAFGVGPRAHTRRLGRTASATSCWSVQFPKNWCSTTCAGIVSVWLRIIWSQ